MKKYTPDQKSHFIPDEYYDEFMEGVRRIPDSTMQAVFIESNLARIAAGLTPRFGSKDSMALMALNGYLAKHKASVSDNRFQEVADMLVEEKTGSSETRRREYHGRKAG